MSDHVLLAAPVAIPLVFIALTTLAYRHPRIQVALNLMACIGVFMAALALLLHASSGRVLVTHFGSWLAPFGISFVADNLAAAMVFITALMGVVVAVYQLGDTHSAHQPMFAPLYQGLLLGVVGAFLTGDLFNLYVWFEVMLIASFGLLVLGGHKDQLDAGVKYVMLNLLMTTVFLLAVALLYGATGTLNMADAAQRLASLESSALVNTLALLFFLAFASKAALFPLFFWLPASYHTASPPVLAIFAALLTKVGVYAIVRSFTLVFPVSEWLLLVLMGVAALTMLTGVLGAASHFDVRKILSFHIISQIGYMLVGLIIATPLALAGTVFYIIHHIIVKANLFLIAGLMRLHTGSYELKQMGGLHKKAPLLALLFFVPAASLAGLPPLSGFWAKFLVIKPALYEQFFVLAIVALVVGVLTLYSMLKIWNEGFWKAQPKPHKPLKPVNWRNTWHLYGPITVLSLITLSIGFYPQPLIDFSLQAAAQLSDSDMYIKAVLGASDEIP